MLRSQGVSRIAALPAISTCHGCLFLWRWAMLLSERGVEGAEWSGRDDGRTVGTKVEKRESQEGRAKGRRKSLGCKLEMDHMD